MALLKYPERLLQSWPSLNRFAQELYAMFRVAGDGTDIAAAEAPGRAAGAPEGAVVPARDADRVRRAAEPIHFSTTIERPAASPPSRPKVEPPRRVEVRAPSAAPVVQERVREATPTIEFPARDRPRPGPPPADEGEKRSAPEPPPARPRREEPARPRREESTPRREEGRRDEPAPPEPRRSGEVRARRTRRELDPYELPFPPGFEYEWPFGGGGTTVFVGKVVSHAAGSPASVKLYRDGPGGDPDEAAVDVTIPTLADGESLPAEMWLFGVFQFTDADGNDVYYAQPPIWLA